MLITVCKKLNGIGTAIPLRRIEIMNTVNVFFLIRGTSMPKNEYGKIFKKLRKERNFSLDKVSSDIAAKSSLYNWEEGKGSMDFGKVILMLSRLRIKPTEFVNDSLYDNLNFDEITNAYISNNNTLLKLYAQNFLNEYRAYPYSTSKFIRAAVSCNFLNLSTNENLFSTRDTEHLEDLLSKIKDWYYDDLFNFGNTLSLLPSKRIYGLSKLLVESLNNSLKRHDISVQWQHSALNTFLNATLVLYYSDFDMAKKLTNEANKLKLTDLFAYEKIRIKFANELSNYLKTKDLDSSIETFFLILNYLELTQLESDLSKGFSQLKFIYNKQ